MEELLSNLGVGAGAFAVSFAVMQYRVKRLESDHDKAQDELEKKLNAVNISKSGKFKEVKTDYNEKLKTLHERVDRIRDYTNEQFSDIRKDMVDRNDKLQDKMESSFKAMSEKIDALKDLIIQLKK